MAPRAWFIGLGGRSSPARTGRQVVLPCPACSENGDQAAAVAPVVQDGDAVDVATVLVSVPPLAVVAPVPVVVPVVPVVMVVALVVGRGGRRGTREGEAGAGGQEQASEVHNRTSHDVSFLTKVGPQKVWPSRQINVAVFR